VLSTFTFSLIPVNTPFVPANWSPFTAKLQALTIDFIYDLEVWNMNIVMKSTYSTHAN